MNIHASSHARFGPRPALFRLRHRALRWRYRNVPPWRLHLRAAAAYTKVATFAARGVPGPPSPLAACIGDFIRGEAIRAGVYAAMHAAEALACLATGPVVVPPRRYL
jgi:hypothetical protein